MRVLILMPDHKHNLEFWRKAFQLAPAIAWLVEATTNNLELLTSHEQLSYFDFVKSQANLTDWLQSVHEADRPRLQAAYAQSWAQTAIWEIEYRVYDSQHQTHWVRERVMLLPQANGTSTRLSLILSLDKEKSLALALERSVERFKLVTNNYAVGILHLGTDWRPLDANPAMLRLLEVNTLDEIKETTGENYIAPEYHERLHAERAKRRMGISSNYEVEIVGKHGARRNVMIGAIPLSEQGKFSGSIATYTDITEQKQTEHELQEKNIQYVAVLKALRQGVVIIERSGTITEFSPLARYLLDKSKFEFPSIFPIPPGWIIRDQHGRELKGEELPGAVTLRTGNPCHDVLIELNRPDGSSVWITVNSEPLLRNGESLPYATAVCFQEITELKKSHDKLEVSVSELRRFLDSIPDLLFLMTSEGKIVDYRAPDPSKLFMAPEKFLNQRCIDILPDPIATRITTIIHDALLTGTSQSTTYSGAPYYPEIFFEARATSLDGTLVLVIVRDITDSLKAQEREREHQQQLTHLSRLNSLGQMVAGISHEVNQPLQVIANYASTLLNNYNSETLPTTEEIKNLLEAMRNQAYRAGEIVKRFRNFSSPVSRQSTVTAGEIVHETLELLKYELKQREVNVKLTMPSDDPIIVVDRIQIQQILVNLIFNACDAMLSKSPEQKKIDISVAVSNSHLVIEVSDYGTGIANIPEDQLFTTFYTTKKHGIGMGLAISRTIAEAHGGRISAHNNAHGGATFTLEIPLPH
jgi:PAS domain S-box-containing protein